MVPCLGVASGLGGSDRGSESGPIVIRENLPFSVDWKEMFCTDPYPKDSWEEISALNKKLAHAAFLHATSNPFILVITGDHSSGIGTWSGIAEAERKRGGELGLIWMDAHMDSHTPDTSPSGNLHGMPLASLLGHGATSLIHILSEQPKIKPENLFLVGIRCFEEEEKELLERLNVRVYYIEEVQKKGLKEVMSEIVATFSSRQINYGISLDIDFFDPSKMSASGTPVDNGLDPEEFLQAYSVFETYPPIAFEFVEFNPSLDTEAQSLSQINKILARVVQNYSLTT